MIISQWLAMLSRLYNGVNFEFVSGFDISILDLLIQGGAFSDSPCFLWLSLTVPIES